MENNIDRQKLMDAMAGLNLGGALGKAVESRNLESILGALDASQAAQLRKTVSDRAELKKMLSSPEAQAIIKALQKDGKR